MGPQSSWGGKPRVLPQRTARPLPTLDSIQGKDRDLWDALRAGNLEQAKVALESGAMVGYMCADVFEYKSRKVDGQPIHWVARYRAEARKDEDFSGWWRDESSSNAFFDGAVIRITTKDWKPENKDTRGIEFKRSRTDRHLLLETRPDGSTRKFEVAMQGDGTLRVVHPGITWTLSPSTPPSQSVRPGETQQAAVSTVNQASAQALMQLLLDKEADVNAEAYTTSASGELRTMLPIHFAAAAGNVEVIEMLVAKRASPEAPAKKNHVEYYLPIHDAVWFNRRTSVESLLKLRANIYAPNGDQNTGLHLAATLGYVHLVRFFLEKSPDKVELLWMRNNKQLTPLECAIQDGRFPPRDLYLFTQALDDNGRAQAFLKVAQACPSAAAELLRDREQVSTRQGSNVVMSLAPISQDWCRSLRDGAAKGDIEVSTLALLIEKAPRAALDLLEALTDEPEATSQQHHPLPIRARLPKHSGPCAVAFAYEHDDKWEFSDARKPAKPWHLRLAPPDQQANEVEVKILRMKGIVSLEILHALALAPDMRVFSKLSVHALLNFAWSRLQYVFLVDFGYQILALIVLSIWVFDSDAPGFFVRCLLWSVLMSQGLHQVVGYLTGLWGYHSRLGSRKTLRRVVKLHTWGKICVSAGTLLLTTAAYPSMWPEGGTSNVLLAVNCLSHWSHLLFQLRAFRWTGTRLLPIGLSVRPIAGMLVILAVLSLAFTSAFWASDPYKADESMIFGVIVMLLSGNTWFSVADLDDLDAGPRTFLIILTLGSIFIFLTCALSVFIAVLGDCYDLEQERTMFTFLLERSRICCGLYGDVTLTNGFVVLAFVLLGVAFIATLLEATSAFPTSGGPLLPAWIPAVLLTFCVLVAQALVRAYVVIDWEKRFLWICHMPNVEIEAMFMAPDEFDELGEAGRISRIKRYIHEQSKSIMTDNAALVQQSKSLATLVDTTRQELRKQMESLQERQNAMTETLDAVMKALDKAPPEPISSAVAASAAAPQPAPAAAELTVRPRPAPLASTLSFHGLPPAPPPPLPPPAAPQPVALLHVKGCCGKYSLINGVYELRLGAIAGRPSWSLASRSRECHLFHNGRGRWVISRKLGDSSSCYAYVDDCGVGCTCPAECAGPWMRCDDRGNWHPEPLLQCIALAC